MSGTVQSQFQDDASVEAAAGSAGTSAPLLELTEISKTFGSLRAVNNVSLKVGRGEIHALLGENGAGKSTLVKIIYGLLRPDTGNMLLDGEGYTPSSPAASRRSGVGMVFQHFSLFDALTVEENIALALDRNQSANLSATIHDLSKAYGLTLDPKARIAELSAGERQRVEIVRCLLQDPQILIMDEPTSVLTPQEAEQLFVTLRRLADAGCSIIYISHKLDEIRVLCESATVMRRGEVVATCDPRDVDAGQLAELMVGKIERAARPARAVQDTARLVVRDLSLPAEELFGVSLKNISLSLHAGEIFGIAGIAGNGQQELLAALSGEVTSSAPEAVQFDGQAIGVWKPDERRAAGMCFVSEERLGHAALPEMDLIGNATLTARVRKQLERLGFMNWRKAETFANHVIGAFDVRTGGPRDAAASLSGGNLQKYILGREILQAPSVLIVSQPTWGIDAGARAAIHDAFLELATSGCAILVISQDLDELFDLCDRLAVIAQGHLSPAFAKDELDAATIGQMMGGLS
ncbi:MAG: ABC transporter ATP-binding protein [Pseudomonadota bacterium]